MTFAEFNLSPRLTAGVEAFGYLEPTPIQRSAIPPIQKGRDVMGLAQTGTGKTAAFALPILQRLEEGPRNRVRALIVAPTRELAEQIHQSFVGLGKQTRLRSTAIYGGVSMVPQIQALRTGTEIVVACPGRLLDLVGQGHVNLSGVEVLVLDEADHMFDMGFLPDVRRIVKAVPAQRQTLLFSATMPPDIRALAAEVLHDPVTVQIGRGAPVETVSHALYPVAQHLKTALLMELLLKTGNEPVLVFTRTKHRAKRVGEQLVKAGFRATSLQGNLSQTRRQAALAGFKTGEFRIMVATDIAARGIDVSGISHVINYDMPETTDAYTHRIGRTGRAELTGEAFTFVTGEDNLAVRDVERVLGYKLERRTISGFDYTAPAPQRDQEFARGPRPQQVRRSAPRSNGQPQAGGVPRPVAMRITTGPARTEMTPRTPAPTASRSATVSRPGDGPARSSGTLRASLTDGNRDLLAARDESATRNGRPQGRPAQNNERGQRDR